MYMYIVISSEHERINDPVVTRRKKFSHMEEEYFHLCHQVLSHMGAVFTYDGEYFHICRRFTYAGNFHI